MATTSTSPAPIPAWAVSRSEEDILGGDDWLPTASNGLFFNNLNTPNFGLHIQTQNDYSLSEPFAQINPQLVSNPGNLSPNLCNNARAEDFLSRTYPSSDQNSPLQTEMSPFQIASSPMMSTMPPTSPNFTHTAPILKQGQASSASPVQICVQRPTVTIEDYGDQSAVAPIELTRSNSKRSHYSDHSRALLSPHLDDSQYEADCASSIADTTSPVASQFDYFALPLAAQDSLIEPEGSPKVQKRSKDEYQIASAEILSPNEQERARRLSEKRLEVYDWLSASDVGSDAPGPRRSRTSKRRPHRNNSDQTDPFDETSATGISGVNPTSQTVENENIEVESDDAKSASDGGAPPMEQLEEPANDDDAASSCPSRPWADPEPVANPPCQNTPCQPATSNLAITRFQARAKEIDNASLAPTIGSDKSRRRSESDLASVYNQARHPLTGMSLAQHATSQRKPSLLGNLSARLKRKNSTRAVSPPQDEPSASSAQQMDRSDPAEASATQENLIKMPSLTLNTNVGEPGQEPKSPLARGMNQVRQIARRARSRSDIRRPSQPNPGLADLWRGNGGPPVATLGTSAVNQHVNDGQVQSAAQGFDSDDEAEPAMIGNNCELVIRNDIPLDPSSRDGFLYHAKMLNQNAPNQLLARIVDEQMRRYQYLRKLSGDHTRSIHHKGTCTNGDLCRTINPNSHKLLEPKTSSQNNDSTAAIFYISYAGAPQDPAFSRDTSNVQATFPKGIPLPPVPRLPARFECPLCFKVKDFQKPSDWTKHVHEDLQPFTCTFIECEESKSFKRKADWVRHENEGHRHLESWQCKGAFTGEECSHVCYRKDNFVQHLVREHKVPEPKVRTGRIASKSPVNRATETLNMTAEQVWQLVDSCRFDSTKNAREEPCRFCNEVFPNFKKLTVHLSQHLLQISLPVLQALGHGISGVEAPTPVQHLHPIPQPVTSVPSFTSSPTGTESMIPADIFATSLYAGSMPIYNQSFPPVPTALMMSNPSVYAGAPIQGRQPSVSLPGSLHNPLRQRSVSYGGHPSPNMQFHEATYPPTQMPTNPDHLQPPGAAPYFVPWQIPVPSQQTVHTFQPPTMSSSPASQPEDAQSFNRGLYPFQRQY